MNEIEKDCLTSYKKYLEEYGQDAYVNTTYIHSAKAIVVTLFCIDFEHEKKNVSVGVHNTCTIQFWVPYRFVKANCSNGANARIPLWLAVKNIDKCLESNVTNLCK